MEANLLSIVVVCVPLLAAPVALIWGLRKALLATRFVEAAILIAPYVYFGIWALIEGENPWETFKAIFVSSTAMIMILGWMLAWAAAYGASAAILRLGWLRWRAA